VKACELCMMTMDRKAIAALCMLSIVNFLENYMRTLISVSIIPFLDYDSYNYSLLSGTICTFAPTIN
jgi:hypothetical protein